MFAPLCQRDFGVIGECAPTHAGDHDRNLKLNRLFGEAGAENSFGGTAFPIAFERDAGQGTRDEGQIVKRRPLSLAQRPKSADAVSAQLCLNLDIFNDVWG